VKRKPPGISDLIAARVKTTRRAPGAPASGPFLRISHGEPSAPQVSTSDSSNSADLPERAAVQIRTLIGKLNTVIRKGLASAIGANEVQVIQACIDKTVDAVATLLHSHRPSGTALYRGLDVSGFFDVRRGGRFDLIKNHLSIVGRIVTNATTVVAPPRRTAESLAVMRENLAAHQITQDDLDFAAQISRMTQLELLSHTSNQFSRPRPRSTTPILDHDSNE
jgi:hypothetical protein